MPIYAYLCASCGHAKDVLQKISEAPLTVCPVCGAAAFTKQVTAAGFQLKGSGWYVTDFRAGNSGKQAKPGDAAASADTTTAADTAAAADAAAADVVTPAASVPASTGPATSAADSVKSP